MKREYFILILLCILCSHVSAQNFTSVHDGIEYAEVTRQLADKQPVKINLLRLDLTKARLDVHHALDKAIGVETTSSIATRHGAVAAINAGFFRLDKSPFAGEAAGILMIDGELFSESLNDRATLILSNLAKDTKIFLGNYRSRNWIQFDKDDWDSSIELSGINRESRKGEAILYQGALNQELQRMQAGIELRLSGCKLLKFDGKSSDARTHCEQVEIVKDGSQPKMTNPHFVAMLDAEYVIKNAMLDKLSRLKSSRKPTAMIRTRINDGNNFFFPSSNVDITNGVSLLVKNGKIDITWQQEKAGKAFVETRHPRTAVAKLKDGKFLMMTVDGRQPGVSAGMNLYELADYLLSLGAVDAMNLDGGGSTTMFLDGKAINKPSDKEGERKVGDAILVTLRNTKSSPTKRKH